MTIELRLLRQAQALAAHRNFSRAAEALGISQPTLSRSIKELEASIGLALFTRAPSGVEPTDFGQVFLQHAEDLVARVMDLDREVAMVKGLQVGEIALGVGPYAAEAIVPACVSRFSAAYPGLKLRVEMATPDVLARRLRERGLDLIVAETSVIEADEELELIASLARIPAFILARARHPLARADGVTMADVMAYPFVHVTRMPPRIMRRLLATRGSRHRKSPVAPPPFPAIEVPTVPLAMSVVLDSDAVMLASLAMVRTQFGRKRIVPLVHEPWMHSEFGILRLRNRTLSPAAAALVKLIRQAGEESQREAVSLQPT